MKNKGYTLLEVTIVILMLMLILTTISVIYVNIVKSTVLANDYYQALENVRLGTEKIWRVLKYGWNFQASSSTINFRKKDCMLVTINLVGSKLNYCEGSICSSLFDENLVKVNNFLIATDMSNTTQRYTYFQYAPKIIILYYNLEIKSRRGLTSTLEFEQAVAPLNSVYTTSTCQ